MVIFKVDLSDYMTKQEIVFFSFKRPRQKREMQTRNPTATIFERKALERETSL